MLAKIINKKIITDEITLFEGDNNAEKLTFSVSKNFNGLNLSDFTAFLKTEDEEGNLNKIPMSKSNDGDNLLLSVVVTTDITGNIRQLNIQIVFESSDGEIVFNTEIIKINVNPSINADSYIASEYPQVLVQWQSQMAELAQTANNAWEISTTKASEASASATVASTKASEASASAINASASEVTASASEQVAISKANEAYVSALNAAASAQIAQSAMEGGLTKAVVSILPTENVSTTTIYLVAQSDGNGDNYYNEYMYINNAWEQIGNTKTTMSDYYTKTQIDANIYTKTEVNANNYTKTATDANILTAKNEINANKCNSNVLINGDFSINQRGQTSYNSVGYTVDRWYLGRADSIFNVETKTITNNSTTTAIYLMQAIDLKNATKLLGKQVTLSVKIGSTLYTNTVAIPSSLVAGSQFAIIWLTNGNRISLAYGAGTKFYVEITVAIGQSLTVDYVKLELGNVSTSELSVTGRSYDEELSLCQRYYQILAVGSTNNMDGAFGMGCYSSENKVVVPLHFKPMRAMPSLKISTATNAFRWRYNYIDLTYDSVEALSGNGTGRVLFTPLSTGAIGMAGDVMCLEASSVVALDAEI